MWENFWQDFKSATFHLNLTLRTYKFKNSANWKALTADSSACFKGKGVYSTSPYPSYVWRISPTLQNHLVYRLYTRSSQQQMSEDCKYLNNIKKNNVLSTSFFMIYTSRRTSRKQYFSNLPYLRVDQEPDVTSLG